MQKLADRAHMETPAQKSTQRCGNNIINKKVKKLLRFCTVVMIFKDLSQNTMTQEPYYK
jgi:hypothetical protein